MKPAFIPIPGPDHGVVRRLTAFMRNATSDSHPFLVKLAGKLGITTGAQDRHQAVMPARQSAPQAPPSAFKRPLAPSTADHTLTAEDMAIVEAWDKQLSSMSEDERDTFVAAIARQIEGTVDEAPASLTLDQRFAALKTTEERSEFLTAHSKIILAR